MPLARRAIAMLTRCRHAIAILINPYRPELHYMRGPGPRWHAKRALAGRRNG
jgi:hypothetical protein